MAGAPHHSGEQNLVVRISGPDNVCTVVLPRLCRQYANGVVAFVTEEVVRGPGAVEFREKDPDAMHRGHDLWLSALKQVSEK
jgi:hypothetical protein